MSSQWEAIKHARGLLTSLVAAFTVIAGAAAGLMEWRIAVAVDRALAAQDLATDANIMAINATVADNKRTGEENAEDIEQNRERVEAAFAVLLGQGE